MKSGTLAVLTGAALVVALLLLGAFNLAKPRILVLHSSDRNSSTVIRMDEGIHQTLDKNRQPMSVRWHYLGIDGMPDEEHREDAATVGLRTIEQFNPDVVIAVDDEAQEYVMRRFAGLERPKVIFTAIDHEPKTYGYVGAANVTGVGETVPLTAIRDMLQYVKKGQPVRLAILGDAGPTGKGQVKQVEAFNWAPHSVVGVHTLGDFAAWQAAIKGMDGKADAVLLLSAGGLPASPTERAVVPYPDVIKWIETNAKPLPIGADIDYVEHGGGLSVASSAKAMGEIAAADALAWVKAGPAAPPPQATQNTRYSVGMREAALRARGISLPSIYIEASRLDRLYYP
ncbi:hypothetical protein SAMN05216350_103164 [Polaromonas sp. YR568]|uniref:ABC transporter substrate-binding protein n=1 Tax=Polaromonas sp. YR568 TaxID=1855301 RepID=UPI0008DEE365|nr:hypothetical protein [Polaromonas sp. YR568]SFU61771.1 hypothetical protein SAMN05216350_103164 [Polaromonas sp. YR568]